MREIEAAKAALREKYSQIRRAIPLEARKEFERKIFLRLTGVEKFKACSTLLTYASTECEVDTKGLILHALAHGKTVAAPRCSYGSADMAFFIIKSLSDLERGRFGISEPTEGCPLLLDFSCAVCVVPAVAFDVSGRRIGYGKGYYDKFLSKYPDLYKIGVTYGACLAERLPSEAHDIPVDLIITEKELSNGY
ncbi:MAG: 5-formyltetrahydrofolate cyclo-ligase [Oscillospiraceae bacterium]|nr:5-formyltetrahydrofolate cyclo-ligase [Oscillospiraceae bacterium]